VALGIEPIPPDLTNGMTKASWSVAGLTACHHRTSAEAAIMDACGARISQAESRALLAGIDLNQPAARPLGLKNQKLIPELLRP